MLIEQIYDIYVNRTKSDIYLLIEQNRPTFMLIEQNRDIYC